MARVPDIIRRNPLSQVAPSAPQAGQGWAALADVAGMAAQVVKPAAEEGARRSGEKSVTRDPNTGELTVQERSLFGGEMAAIHNNAAYAKYLGQKEVEIGQTMSELAVQHQFDPAGFDEATKAYVTLLKADESVPPALKDSLIQGVEIESQRRFNGLQGAAVTRTYRAADTESATARDLAVEDYVSLYVDGAEEEAAEKWKEIEEKSRFRADAPYITETPSETEAYMRGARGAAKAARLIRDLDDLEGADTISEERRAEIEGVLKDPDLSPKVRQQLYTATQGRLKSIDAAGIVKGLTDDSVESMVVRVESAGQADARPRGEDGKLLSTALGSHQFLKGTWAGLVKRHKPEWANGLNEDQIQALRADPQKSSEMYAHFRRENAAVLNNAGLPINPATEYMAHFFGAGGAVQVLSADPSAQVSAIFPKDSSGTQGPGKGAPNGVPDILDANPFLKGMTARDAQVWAARKMTMKASDIAMQSVKVNEIEDPEVRALASQALQDRIKVRKAIEKAEAAVFDERLVQGDASLTEQEILENHDLSTSDQGRLVRGLSAARKEVERLQSTVARIATGDTFNPTDTKDRNSVNDAYTAEVGDQKALVSQEAFGIAIDLARETGIIPSSVVDEIRGGAASENPENVAKAMETLAILRDQTGSGLNGVVGGKALQDQLSDYEFYAKFMPDKEAAARMIKNQETKPKNITNEARAEAKNVSIDDIINHFDQSWFSDPSVGDVDAGADAVELLPTMQQDEMVGELRRLFIDAYQDTGDFDLAQNRALNEFGRTYGVNLVSGRSRIMKFPPQKVYPAVAGSHDWMREQLSEEINTFLFGDEAEPPWSSVSAVIADGASLGANRKWVDLKQIKLVHDATTAKEVKSGRPASYVVYVNRDGVLDQLPERYIFDPTGAKQAHEDEFQAEHERKLLNEVNAFTFDQEKMVNE